MRNFVVYTFDKDKRYNDKGMKAYFFVFALLWATAKFSLHIENPFFFVYIIELNKLKRCYWKIGFLWTQTGTIKLFGAVNRFVPFPLRQRSCDTDFFVESFMWKRFTLEDFLRTKNVYLEFVSYHFYVSIVLNFCIPFRGVLQTRDGIEYSNIRI
jgi:hypothetical protein